MGAAYFYHLTRRPLPETLMMLLSKSLENRWKVAVRGTDPTALSQLDAALWQGPDDSFLAHGLADGQQDADQPVLLTLERTAANNPQCLISVHGAEVSPDEVGMLERTCILFDGNDASALNTARDQWKRLKEAGVSAQYWSEESGRWEKKAET